MAVSCPSSTLSEAWKAAWATDSRGVTLFHSVQSSSTGTWRRRRILFSESIKTEFSVARNNKKWFENPSVMIRTPRCAQILSIFYQPEDLSRVALSGAAARKWLKFPSTAFCGELHNSRPKNIEPRLSRANGFLLIFALLSRFNTVAPGRWTKSKKERNVLLSRDMVEVIYFRLVNETLSF